MHVEFENFFQKIGRHDLLFQFAGGASLFRRLFRLLFQFDAFEAQQILGALDGIFQRAVGVVEHGTLFQAPGAFLGVRLREHVRMKAAAQRVEFFFECGRVEVELARKSKKSEIVHRDGRLHFAAGAAEMHRAHGAARPATWALPRPDAMPGNDQTTIWIRIQHLPYKI